MEIGLQVIWLFLLAIPIASIAWTVTHEEIFREFHLYFVNLSKNGNNLFLRKFAYALTCEFCFSHYVTILFLILTNYKLLLNDWRGYIIGGFALVWIANNYMSIYNHLRLDIKKERVDIEFEEKEIED